MKTRMNDPIRTARSTRLSRRWPSLWGGEYLGKKKAWTCTFCGVTGSHRRGCHYVAQAHHRPPKPVRRGILGPRTRAVRTRAAVAR